MKSIPDPVTDPDFDFITSDLDPGIESVKTINIHQRCNSCVHIGMARMTFWNVLLKITKNSLKYLVC